MKFAGYKRAATESAAKTSSATLRSEVKKSGHEFVFFAWDLTMGQRGFLRVKRAIESGKVQGVIVEDLKDLGRNLVGLIKAIDLVFLSSGITILTVHKGLRFAFDTGTATPEARMIAALIFAHNAYSNDNRKIGIAAARAAGARPGRPEGMTLNEATPTIEQMTEEDEDHKPPSVRKLAERLDCSTGKAAGLLRLWKSKPCASDSGKLS